MKKILLIVLSFPITLVLYIVLFSNSIKYSEEIIINENIDTVTLLFDNPYNMKEYMYGFQSYNLVSGKIGESGSKSEIIIEYLNEDSTQHKIVMNEEIILNNLPTEKKVTYKANGVFNIVSNRFEKISENKTRFINEQEFIFKGYKKIIGFFMPSVFKEQSKVYLQNFKDFVENH